MWGWKRRWRRLFRVEDCGLAALKGESIEILSSQGLTRVKAFYFVKVIKMRDAPEVDNGKMLL